MSESLATPWLYTFCTTSASTALDHGYDLSDTPFSTGCRVQLLRFLTFRPASLPNGVSTDVWALVGDKTHCIAARFHHRCVDLFHRNHAISFTSLKGASITLGNLRITVAKVQVDESTGGAGPYRQGQWGLVLDVRGFRVVSSIKEPIWFGGVKLVTSPNAVREEEEGARKMKSWIRHWVRYKSLVAKAKQEKAVTATATTLASAQTESGKLPTPAQREGLVEPKSPSPRLSKDKEESQESLAFPTSPTTTAATSAMWADFDLDASIDDQATDDALAWSTVVSANEPSTKTLQSEESHPTQTQTQTQTQTASQDLDPDESGLSDYERESRRQRKRAKADQAGSTPISPPIPRAPLVGRAADKRTLRESSVSTTSSKASSKRRRNQNAISAL